LTIYEIEVYNFALITFLMVVIGAILGMFICVILICLIFAMAR